MALKGRTVVTGTEYNKRRDEVNDRILGNTCPVGTFIIGDIKPHQNGKVKYVRVALHDPITERKIGYTSDSKIMGLQAIYEGTTRVDRLRMTNATDYDALHAAHFVTIRELEGNFIRRKFTDGGIMIVDADGNPETEEARAHMCIIGSEEEMPAIAAPVEAPVEDAPAATE